MSVKEILVVDDEPKILEVVSSYLESKGFKVFTAETGGEALDIFAKNRISLVVLDLMLPDISGEEICTRLRKESRVPVIMLTAKTQENDLLNGLQSGADDYITKPFSLKELHARIEAILRRSAEDLAPLLAKLTWNEGDLIIDFDRNVVKKGGEEVSLTPIEWRIISALVKYPKKVFTRDELIDIAFDAGFDGYDRVIDTHIKNLRQKIEDDTKNTIYILTVRGRGYKFGGERQ
ncbi:response regulator transcription factor [Parasporobacterium paucivorans]|uniref:Stage 0 sporulation protein A homolog n=1 Tax=Parasporobacterium paucivorans DSM 15970 TaxID=1122934 RepID=A0A1M6E1I6_9FIRM|nr:response regulator transcription factor [Parasporobacterium paucivorans]SHI79367.1 DNA-binding response regulator, OmpR family, contains REC and winged-helix (wHTH) domain [Parasporobacterium paucivorans DSM 15970]